MRGHIYIFIDSTILLLHYDLLRWPICTDSFKDIEWLITWPLACFICILLWRNTFTYKFSLTFLPPKNTFLRFHICLILKYYTETISLANFLLPGPKCANMWAPDPLSTMLVTLSTARLRWNTRTQAGRSPALLGLLTRCLSASVCSS